MTIKRLNYFTGQFLEEKDFRDEQKYHVESQRLHNENLHTWGIAKGLEVTSSDDKKHLRVSKGMAVDKDGKQIVINEDKEIEIIKFSEQSFYLTVLHEEVETDHEEWIGKKFNTRVEEKPHFYQETSKPDDTSTKIILAKVIINPETEMIADIDLKDRKYAGSVIADKSIPLSKMKSYSRTGSGSIKTKGQENVYIVTITPDQDPLKNHRFFIASVIPTSPDSIIEWWWQVENTENQIKYNLWVKNQSDKTIHYNFIVYEIAER